MIVRQQKSLFVPVNRVIRISNYTAVYESVSSCHCSDVLHGPNPRRALFGEREKEREIQKDEERKRNVVKQRQEKGKRTSLVNGAKSR